MAEDLRSLVERDVRECLRLAGGNADKVDKSAIAKRAIALGVSKATAWRWINALLNAPLTPPARLAGESVPAISTGPSRPIFSPEVLARDPEGFDKVIGPSGIGLVEALQKCMTAAEDVMVYSRRPDGSVRMGKSLVAASEHMRRVIETAAKIHESMVTIQKIDMFYEALNVALAEASPEIAARVLELLRQVNAKWRGEAS